MNFVILFGFFLGVFLISDSLLAILLGNRYMTWGLDYAPAVYSEFIKHLTLLPPKILLIIKLLELLLGLVLIWISIRFK